MDALTSKQRKYLRAQAHHLKAVVQVGKAGLSQSLLSEVDRALEEHELIKVKFVACKEARRELSAKIEAASKAGIAGIVGNTCILYRPNSEEKKQNYSLPM